MDSDDSPSLLSRVLAVGVLVIVAVIAFRLLAGLIGGLISMVIWIAVLAALVAAGFWAYSTLSGGRKRRAAKANPAIPRPGETPFDVEMRKLDEQLRALRERDR